MTRVEVIPGVRINPRSLFIGTKLDRYHRGSAEYHFCLAPSFSSNGFEILLVLPENELHQQKATCPLADLIGFVQQNQMMKSPHFITRTIMSAKSELQNNLRAPAPVALRI
jgi:hypothetical protein